MPASPLYRNFAIFGGEPAAASGDSSMLVVQPDAYPQVSVVVVSDFNAGAAEGWAELADTLAGLAAQDIAEPVEVLLIVDRGELATIPPFIAKMLPGMRIVPASGTTSYDLKNAGAKATTADIVLLLDADCKPVPGWLGAAVDYLRRHPRTAVLSGRTIYKGSGLLRRIVALLDRAYVDPGRSGPTSAISNNNAAFRREVLQRHPLTNAVGPFGSRPHADNILKDGGELAFEPAMVTAHGFGGWSMVQEIRFGQGFAFIRYRQLEPGSRYGRMVALGYVGLPLLFVISVLTSWWDVLRVGRQYGLSPHELPLAAVLAVVVRAYELPGMIAALRHAPVGTGMATYR